MSHSSLCFSAFWFWAFAGNFGKAPLLRWLLCEHLSPDVMQRRKKSVPGFVCCGSGPAAACAELRREVCHFFERREKGSRCHGEIRELPLPAGQPLSSRGWPLSQWAAKSPKLTGWNPGLIKIDAKPPIDFKALAQPIVVSNGRLTPLFMGLFLMGFLRRCSNSSQLRSPADRQPAPNRVHHQTAFYQF